MVGNDRAGVESGADHAAHFISGDEHFSAVDSLQDEALKNDLVPVDGDTVLEMDEALGSGRLWRIRGPGGGPGRGCGGVGRTGFSPQGG